ncbi:TonB-dependent receptor domain-containing protein [SAR92 clade bacterium H246]
MGIRSFNVVTQKISGWYDRGCVAGREHRGACHKRLKKSLHRVLLISLTGIALVASAASATAPPATAPTYSFNIPRQPADDALPVFGKQADITVIYPFDRVANHSTNRLVGTYSVTSAVAILFKDTGLFAHFTSEGHLVISEMDDSKGKNMNTTKKSLLAAMVGLFAAGGMGTVQAQEQVGESARAQSVLDEIIVTAQKREASMQEVPIAITAFSGKKLERALIEDSLDLEMVTPGLSWSTAVADANLTIRGVGAPFSQGPGADPASSVYIDGVYQARFSGAMMSLMDFERVEVMKGPQGILYGRNSTGGAINFISKQPSNELSGAINVQFGNYNLTKIKLAGDIPLIADKLLFRAAVMKADRDGYSENILTGGQLDEEDLLAGRFTLKYFASDQLDLTLRGNFLDQKGQAQSASKNQRPAFGAAVIGDPRKIMSDLDEDSPKNNQSIDLTIRWSLGSGEFKSITGYTDHELGPNFRDLDATEIPLLHELGLLVNSETFTQEFIFTSEPNGRVDWLVGAFMLHDNHSFTTAISLPVFDIELDSFETSNTTDAFAVFSHVTYHISENMRLNGGIRYSDERKKNTSREFFNFELVAGPVAGEKTWDAWTPKIGIDYSVNEDIMIYASTSKGFKSGSFPSSSVGAPPVEPETLNAYEAGVKGMWRDGRLRLNASAFYYDYTDLQVTSPDPDDIASEFVQNAGKAEIKGFELELTALLVENLKLDLGLGWLDAKYVEFIAAGGIDLSGNRLPVAPEFTANLGVEYTHRLADIGSVIFGINYYFSEEKFFNENNGPLQRQKSYSLLNTRIGYESADGHWLASLYGKNMTDEVIREFSFDDGFFHLETLAPPRTYGIEIAYNF